MSALLGAPRPGRAGRAPVALLAGAVTTVAASTSTGWLGWESAGWGTGVLIAVLTAAAVLLDPLWQPLAWSASVLGLVASTPFVLALLGAGTGCGFDVVTPVRSVGLIAMGAAAGTLLLPGVRGRLLEGAGAGVETTGLGWFGGVLAIGSVSAGWGPEALRHGAAAAPLMGLLGLALGAVIALLPLAAVALVGLEAVLLATPLVLWGGYGAGAGAAVPVSGSASVSSGSCLLPGTNLGVVLGYGLAFVLAHLLLGWGRRVLGGRR